MKKRKKPYRPRSSSWTAIQIALMGASQADQDDSVHRWLATEAYAAIQRLTTGALDLNGYISVSKLNSFAYTLAMQLYPGLDDESRAIVGQQKDVIEEAAHALASIGERYGRTGKFGAAGSELALIRRSLSLMDTLLGYATVGETVRAMRDADQLTQQALRHVPQPPTNQRPDRTRPHEAHRP